MKYTRVKAVTCALTASVIIFGSAAHTNASGVSYDLPAAGVGLVLDEGSSLSSVQEETSQSEQTAEAVQEAQEAPAVTSEDIEAGATGVGEAAIDTEVVSHVQEQQVEAAIDNGVGVASVLNAAAPETAPAADNAPAASDTEVALTAGVEAAVNVLPAPAAEAIVEPVDPAAVQAAADSTPAEQPEKEQTSGGNDPEPDSQQPSETASEQDTTEKQTESEQESASETESTKESASGNETESATEETSSESESESSTEETSSESESESSTEETSSESGSESSTEETSSENESESSTEETFSGNETESATEELPSESESESATEELPSESETESSVEQLPAESQTETASQQPSESTAETAGTGEAATEESTAAAPVETESSTEQTVSESVAAETAAQSETVQAASVAASHTAVSSAGSSVAEFALQFVGNPYEYGGTSLTNGADCSGFVMSVYENFGVSLPHSSSADRNVGTEVAGGLSSAQPGDIVCYSGHVGIYIGNGQIVHASTEETGIKVSDADYRTPITVRRIFN